MAPPSLSKYDPPIISLLPAVQNYAWGIVPAAEDCIVARIYAYATSSQVDATRPYAELWIGTHPSGPALVRHNRKPLLDHLKTQFPGLPRAVPPFLLKILSVGKPLSIQAHPHKELAEKLHREKPDKYKDDNHKPEMCVALTDFEGMCNFRPTREILANLDAVPSFTCLCDKDAIRRLRNAPSPEERRLALQTLFASIMSAPVSLVIKALKETVKTAKGNDDMNTISGLPRRNGEAMQLFLRLESYYPGDVGCFSAFLLNHVRIRPGQAFFMAANEPHAYLKGQCVEIMALSDNVVRAGLTPKFKDVDVLVEMLTYNDGMPTIMNGEAVDDYSTVYQPPVTEFELMRTVVPPQKTYRLPPVKGPSVVIVLGGTGWLGASEWEENRLDTRSPLTIGSIYYIEDSKAVSVHADSPVVAGAPSPDLFFFRASARQY
eukprot:GFKZ01000523.1.p1 GENE.GFKZ01000523.1~~GFKZ01000523.1.p1  ORF type:complete len:433 (-),score=50.58 GFKZ01000523.1:917-2215(-)